MRGVAEPPFGPSNLVGFEGKQKLGGEVRLFYAAGDSTWLTGEKKRQGRDGGKNALKRASDGSRALGGAFKRKVLERKQRAEEASD